jgi:hypothetical protein
MTDGRDAASQRHDARGSLAGEGSNLLQGEGVESAALDTMSPVASRAAT